MSDENQTRLFWTLFILFFLVIGVWVWYKDNHPTEICSHLDGVKSCSSVPDAGIDNNFGRY